MSTYPESYVNHGDNAWQLTAASLVALQSVPGSTITTLSSPIVYPIVAGWLTG